VHGLRTLSLLHTRHNHASGHTSGYRSHLIPGAVELILSPRAGERTSAARLDGGDDVRPGPAHRRGLTIESIEFWPRWHEETVPNES
jgi:hypothetical protein